MRPCAEVPNNDFGDQSLPTLNFLRTYTNPYNRDVEDFCEHAQKFLIMISENKVLLGIPAYVRRIQSCLYEVFAHMHK